MRHILIAVLLTMTARADQLRITVYDRAHFSKEVIEMAVDNLSRIFRDSKIDIRVVEGDPASDEASLFIYSDSLTQGREAEAACRARRDIALQIVAAAPRGLKKSVLGMAQPLASTGLNIRVFGDRVRDAALRQCRPHSVVLAHVIAHEIGHVLLRDSTHTGRGLMSSVWTEYEYGWMQHALMLFTGDQSQKMRMSLRGAGCPNNAVVTGAGAVDVGDLQATARRGKHSPK